MGNANPLAAMAGKNAANQSVEQAKDGLSTLTGSKTAEQLAHEERAKDRVAEYEQKKQERAERKKKLAGQWAQNKQSSN
jgi:hypothetical protein